MLFVGGAATIGPGQIVAVEKREPIRSHHDIEKDNTKYYKIAVKHYETLAKRAASNAHAIDIFCGCLDQVGLSEMHSLSNSTGGSIVLSDAFNTAIFKQSFQKLFDKDQNGILNMAFNANFDVQVTNIYNYI